MLADKKRNTNIGILLGIGLQFAGRTVLEQGSFLGLPVVLAGSAAFIWGCCNYAQGKGYHWALGFLGLLSCFGLIVLVLLPDKHKDG